MILESLPLVSVIMIVRNGERFLAEALRSVVAQDYRPIEIIVVDGQSTDQTAQIAYSFPEVRYLFQETLGVANAYNLGVKAARGELIAFLSYDDLWERTKLSKQVLFLQEHPEIAYTIVKVKFFLEPGCAFPPGLRRNLLESDHIIRLMETLLLRREIFDQVGLFDPAFSPADDMDWLARVQDAHVPMGVVPEVLLFKRIHDANTSLNSYENMQRVLTALKRSADRKRSMAQVRGAHE
jgi:glycosyltransferase involved in cell wall biosynthesis